MTVPESSEPTDVQGNGATGSLIVFLSFDQCYHSRINRETGNGIGFQDVMW